MRSDLTSTFKRIRSDLAELKIVPWLLLAPLSCVWLIYAGHTLHLAALICGILRGQAVIDPERFASDYLAFWPAGHIALTRHAARIIYDPLLFSNWTARHVGPGLPNYLDYFYPPPALLTTIILAPFGLNAGLPVWTLALLLPSVVLLRRAGAPWPVIAAGLLSGASLSGIMLGQFGPLGGSLFIAALLAVDRCPVGAGCRLGLLSCKPQAGLLGPVVLLARGEFRALAAGGAIVACLVATVTIVTSPAIWPVFLAYGVPTAHAHLVAPYPSIYESSGITVFWMARSLGAPVDAAEVGQLLAAALAVTWCWRVWRRPQADPVARAALTVCLTMLVTPYAYVNDMTGFSIMVAWLAWQRGRLEPLDVFFWLWPVLSPLVATLIHIEIAPLAIVLGALRAQRALDGIGMPAPACYPAPT